MNKILELRQKRNTLWEKTKNFLEEHRDENGMVPKEALEQYDKMTADVQALGTEIKRLEDQMEIDAMLSAPTSTPVQMAPSAQKKEAPVKAPADNQPTAAPAAVEEEDVTDDTELVAVIAAAIAAYEGTSVEGLVVRSIRKINRNENWRRG